MTNHLIMASFDTCNLGVSFRISILFIRNIILSVPRMTTEIIEFEALKWNPSGKLGGLPLP